jgi:hypothetical protein
MGACCCTLWLARRTTLTQPPDHRDGVSIRRRRRRRSERSDTRPQAFARQACDGACSPCVASGADVRKGRLTGHSFSSARAPDRPPGLAASHAHSRTTRRTRRGERTRRRLMSARDACSLSNAISSASSSASDWPRSTLRFPSCLAMMHSQLEVDPFAALQARKNLPCSSLGYRRFGGTSASAAPRICVCAARTSASR